MGIEFAGLFLRLDSSMQKVILGFVESGLPLRFFCFEVDFFEGLKSGDKKKVPFPVVRFYLDLMMIVIHDHDHFHYRV